MTNEIQDQDNEEAISSILKAKGYTDSIIMSALSICDIMEGNGQNPPNVKVLKDEITKRVINSIKNSSCDNEIMLAAQAITLDFIFNRLLTFTGQSKQSNTMRANLEMALRVQNQCRKTLLAINEIRNPQQSTIVKQQNVAFNQQVNNTHTKNIKLENELIKEKHHETMDSRRKIKAISIDQKTEAMEMVNWSKNSSRESGEQNECI